MVIRAGCQERNRESRFDSRDRNYRVISAKSACVDASNAAAHQHNRPDGAIGRHGPLLASSRGVRDPEYRPAAGNLKINEWHEVAANRLGRLGAHAADYRPQRASLISSSSE
jgi:hypothetical protein